MPAAQGYQPSLRLPVGSLQHYILSIATLSLPSSRSLMVLAVDLKVGFFEAQNLQGVARQWSTAGTDIRSSYSMLGAPSEPRC